MKKLNDLNIIPKGLSLQEQKYWLEHNKKQHMDLQLILETAKDCLALKPDGFDGNLDGYDKAILGLTDNGQLVYSKEIMVELAIQSALPEILTEEDAWEFLEFNTFSAYVGEQTPIYVNTFKTI
jgi:hypothetical protein